MYQRDFSHVRAWVFDLDNTLYPPEARLFDQIERLMTDYIVTRLGVTETEAGRLRSEYWRSHGTTLAGLMDLHRVDPEDFLDAVHAIDLTNLPRDEALRLAIAALPGRKIVYTNGSREHARRVTQARGLDGLFDALYGVEDAGYAPKPRRDAFERVFGLAKLEADRGAMFEDDPRNLEVPHALGMRTVLVGPHHEGDHIHHRTEDLTRFLSQVI
ncbi:pyrimidine 5'-nucleotidase [Halovulum dunhuangense]|uniref:Pyrimidine 5'-nucleotidase n=1 Tax=Halovulum dunhuangense TaxID=1505036 RepID=A0A849L3K5_9RHOB|nr:pyrimidine 5'-nucleotidase [Halovulum dunhuangense]NNU80936.1 pyrimidine 5'-nucleotidase [Halovulum dunhuangense]